MGLIDWLTETRAEKINPLNPRDPGLVDLFGFGTDTQSGQVVNETSAANYASYFCGLRAIAEAVAGLPLWTYRRNGDDRERVRGHRAQRALMQPNPNMTAVSFREAIIYQAIGWGDFVAEISRNEAGGLALWPIHRNRIRIDRDGRGQLVYRIQPTMPGESEQVLQAEQVIHVPNPDPNGIGEIGKSAIAYHRESIGLGLAAEQAGATFFGNGMKVSGVLKLTRPATRERKIEIGREYRKFAAGGGNQAGLMILDHESDYQRMGIPPDDAQFLETRIFQIQEIARILRISPTKLFDFSRSTFSNLEEINRQFANETILPWSRRIDQELNRKLLSMTERPSLFIEHDIRGLLEGDMESQAGFFASGRQWGWLSANDVRRKLNLNGIPEGDTYLSPGNMVPADQLDEMAAPQPAAAPPPPRAAEDEDEDEDENDERLAAVEAELRVRESELAELRRRMDEFQQTAHLQIVRNICERFVRNEQLAIERQSVAGGNFLAWMDKFYPRHGQKFTDLLRSEGYDRSAAIQRHCDESRQRLLEAADGDPDGFRQRIELTIRDWDRRADTLWREESNGRSSNI